MRFTCLKISAWIAASTGSLPRQKKGIKLRYTGELAPVGGNAGTVTFSQNSLTFQVGGEANQFSEFSLSSIKVNDLGKGEANASGFDSLAQVKVMNSEQAQDAIRVIDKAIQEVNLSRGEMGAFQKNNLESNLNYLRIAHENSVSSESVIRDADMAEEMATFTRNQIMMEASTSMLAQANQNSMTVLKLIGQTIIPVGIKYSFVFVLTVLQLK